jgi:ribokinase
MSQTGEGSVVVIGSVNMDLVARGQAIPRPGETVVGAEFQTFPGGKGANQAVAIARLGTRCLFVGRVGDDDYGVHLREEMGNAGVNVDFLGTTPGVATGVGVIMVNEAGENAICVASGANHTVTSEDVDRAEEVIANASVCVLQLEIPIETTIHGLRKANRHGVETILDPAPAVNPFPSELYEADILTPNEGEAAMITEDDSGDINPDAVAAEILAKGAKCAVVTLGPEGALVVDEQGTHRIDGIPVTAVDATAAGDAFSGALAVARTRGLSISEAARFANAAGAASCRTAGAMPSMPTEDEVMELLEKHS